MTTVVMTRDRWSDLRSSLVHRQPPVVLVDNGSTDGTPALVRRHFPDVHVVALPGNVGAVARNIGTEQARTPYVAFADDDSWWAPGALDRAADLLDRHPRLGLIAGRMLLGDDERLDPLCDVMAASPLPRDLALPGPSVLGFAACGAVVRREAFLQAGGFDPVVEFVGEEERLALDLATAGWGLAYVEDVVAHHHPSPTRDGRDARRTRVVRNEVLTAVMRRPWPIVLRTAARALRAGGASRHGVVQSVGRMPRALRRRRVVPPQVERARRLLG